MSLVNILPGAASTTGGFYIILVVGRHQYSDAEMCWGFLPKPVYIVAVYPA